MSRKRRRTSDRNTRETQGGHRASRRPHVRAGILQAGILVIAISACYLGWRSLERRWSPQEGAPPGSNERKSVFSEAENALLVLGNEAEPEGMRRAAVAAVDSLVTEFPNNVLALDASANLYSRIGETDAAARLWRDCLRIDPDFPDSYRHLGELARERGDPLDAREMLRRLVELGQASPDMVAKFGDSLLQSGEVDEAIRVLEQHSRGAAVSANALLTLGQAYQRKGEYDKAEAVFRRLVEADPGNARAYYGLANVYGRLGQREKAKECSEKFREFSKVDYGERARELRDDTDAATLRGIFAQTLYQCGHVYAAEGDFKQAEIAWLKTAVLEPRHVQCRHELLGLFDKQERLEDAIEISQQLCDLEPKSPDNWLNLGLLNGRLEGGRRPWQRWEKAQELAPENARFRQAYELVRKGM